MDVGYFIGELLAQRGDVSVPGLGYFVRLRTNGHYNEPESKLYPPAYTVQFDPQHVDDETLVQLIADKRNISLASSKYFTEKYVNSIKMQAQGTQAPIADIGWFYTEGQKLFFKANTQTTDPDFFGYEPIVFTRLNKTPAVQQKTDATDSLVEEEFISSAPVPVPQAEELKDGYRFETDEEHEQYLVALTRKKRKNATITFIILAALFTGLVIYLVDRYDSSIFNLEAKKPKITKTQPVITAKIDTTDVKDSVKTVLPGDTIQLKENTSIKDALTKIAPAPVDSIGFPHWEVMGGTFAKEEEASTAIKNFKTLGVTAHIAADVPGPRFHVSLGTYKTRKEAAKAISTLLKDKRISKEIYPLEIRHKK